MKKIISLLMVLCMLTVSFAAMAEMKEINWADIADQVTWEGKWVANEDWDAGFFLPAAFQEVEVPQELADQGALAIYSTADGSAKMVVMYVELPEGATDAETYAAALVQNGYADAEAVLVNGYEMVTYTDTANNQLVAMSIYEDETAMVFCFLPASDEGFQAVAAVMMASLLTYEETLEIAQ